MAEPTPAQPKQSEPKQSWVYFDLFKAVRSAIYSLPSRFESSLRISGVLATDLFAFNASLSATIEEQVVSALNSMRSVWDPDQKYALYDFERRPQTFPDVVLKASSSDITPQIILGIELKGWYVLAKEREPSFRYKVTPAVCSDADLLVVVPWALSEVVSGTPKVFAPFVVGAKFAAEHKNWYWEHGRSGTSKKGVLLSTVDQAYPTKSDMISDKPESDSGGNFGRLARTGLLDSYIAELFEERLVGISLSAWQKFLSIFTETRSVTEISSELEKLAANLATKQNDNGINQVEVIDKFQEILRLIENRE